MAKAPKKTKKTKKSAPQKSGGDSSVVRIRAGGSAPAKKIEKAQKADAAVPVTTVTASAEIPMAKAEKVKKVRAKRGAPKAVKATGGYFKGAWVELRQVRWPNRRATWSLTGAVLAYSAFFIVLVLLLDAAFKYLFELILGK